MFSTVGSFSAIFTVILKINTFGHKFIFEPQETTCRDSTKIYFVSTFNSLFLHYLTLC